MKTDNAPAVTPTAAGRAAPRSGTAAKRFLGLLGDAILVALLAGIVVLFLSHNGFVGQSDIQPYPYQRSGLGA
jgi:hypothetical protein